MYFFVALLLAVLSGLGVGGGGLFALYLKLFSDCSQIELQALNLMFFLFASAAALAIHLFKRKIYFLPVLLLVLFGVVGSFVGSAVALGIDGDLLGKIFGGMMLLTGACSLRGSRTR